jgi:uncharacterized protein YkwD
LVPFVLVTGLLAVTMIAGFEGPAQATTLRTKMFKIINRVRDHHRVHALRLNLDLSGIARHHSRRMAEDGTLFHSSNLGAKVRPYGSPTWWGENLAAAGTLRRVRKLWMHSSEHRANLLSRHFDHVGVGVVKSGGFVWVTAIFYGS